MPTGKLTEAEFEVLCRRAGLPLTAEQAAEYWPVYQLVETMAAADQASGTSGDR